MTLKPLEAVKMFIKSQNKEILLNTDMIQALRVYDNGDGDRCWIGTDANRDQSQIYPIDIGGYTTRGRGIEVLNMIFDAIDRGQKFFSMPPEFQRREVFKA